MIYPLKLAKLIEHAGQKLRDGGVENYATDAKYLARHAFSMDSAQLISQGDIEPGTELQNHYQACIYRRLSGEPVARIIGSVEFYGLNFQLSPQTLVPRADTEILVGWILDHYSGSGKPMRILDLGTGSGAILISLFKNMPDATGIATDINLQALETASRNAHIHAVKARFEFIQSDWCENINGLFDVIVSNPPYICSPVIPSLEKEVRDFDPVLALDGGADGLIAYDKIFNQSRPFLKPGGNLVLEIGFDQLDSVCALAENYQWRITAEKKDYGGNDRMVVFEYRKN